LRAGVEHDAAADVEAGGAGLVHEQGADRHAEAEIAPGADPAEGAAIHAAGRVLQFVDDLHGADLRCAGD
jgi:hypothetical protein